MAKRIQVQDPTRGPQQIQPAAQPVDLYYRPTLKEPTLHNIYDFGPLSRELRDLLVNTANAKGDAAISEGESAAAQNPGKDYREVFGKLVREGKIPEAASPLFQRGYMQASARSVVGEYHDRLLQRVAEVTSLTDKEGLPNKPVDPNAILSEEWEKLAQNPALQNFYGRQVASELKQRVDEDFKTKAAGARAQAVADSFKTMLSNEIAQQVGMLQQKDEVTPGDIQSLTDLITNRAYDNNVKEPRAVAWAGMSLAIKHIANTAGATEALRMLDTVADVKVAGLALGKDADVGNDLENLKLSLIRQQQHDNDDSMQRKNDQRREAMLTGKEQWLPKLLDAYQKRGNIVQVRDELRDQITNDATYGEFGPLVAQEMFDYADALTSRQGSNPKTVTDLNAHIAAGRFDEADALLRSAINTGDIQGEDVFRFDQRIEGQRSLGSKLQTDPEFQTTLQFLGDSNIRDMAPEIQERADLDRQKDQEEWRQAAAAKMQSLAGANDAAEQFRVFSSEWRTNHGGMRRAVETTMREKKKAADDAVTAKNSRFLDASDTINSAYEAGVYTTAQRDQLLDKNEARTNRSSWYRSPDVQFELTAIENEVTKSEDITDEKTKRLLTGTLIRQFQDKWNSLLTEKLPNTEPRYVESLLREVARESGDEVLSGLGASKKRLTEKVTAGEEPVKAGAEQAETLNDKRNANSWESTVDTAPGSLADNNELVNAKMHPLLPDTARRAYVRLIKHEEPSIFKSEALGHNGSADQFGLSPRERAEDAMGRASLDIVNNPAVPEKEKAEAVVKAYSMVGMRPEYLLSDEIDVSRSPTVRAFVKQTLDQYRAGKADGLGKAQAREIEKSEKLYLDEHKISIKGVRIDPYTTPIWKNSIEMQEFIQARPGDFQKILKRLGVGDDPASVQDFTYRQINTMNRVRGQ